LADTTIGWIKQLAEEIHIMSKIKLKALIFNLNHFWTIIIANKIKFYSFLNFFVKELGSYSIGRNSFGRIRLAEWNNCQHLSKQFLYYHNYQ
jgi:hypothetical protein